MRAGITRSEISLIELDRRRARLDTLRGLARGLGVSVDWLIAAGTGDELTLTGSTQEDDEGDAYEQGHDLLHQAASQLLQLTPALSPDRLRSFVHMFVQLPLAEQQLLIDLTEHVYISTRLAASTAASTSIPSGSSSIPSGAPTTTQPEPEA
jgi:transcriptional regulator with XRE-family HTH domain